MLSKAVCSFDQFEAYIILKGSCEKPNQTENCCFLMKIEPKWTNFWVGQTVTALVISEHEYNSTTISFREVYQFHTS